MMRSFTTLAAFGVATAVAGGGALAEPLPTVAPEEVGLNGDQLARLGERFRADTDAGIIPGAVILILRSGRIGYLKSFGDRDAETGTPMTDDSIFRIYSMTKPITSVVAMQLVEEGRLALADPVADYIPSFAEVTVGTETSANGTTSVEETAAAEGPTVHDLLRHTAGLTYGVFGSGAIKTMYKEAGIGGSDISGVDQASALGDIPLTYEPGTGWDYSRATDVLGAVIEVVEGKPLGEVFKARVFDPLGMTDTAFWVAEEADRARVAQPKPDDTGGRDALIDPATEPAYLSGGGGLVSTAHDYARFVAMLMNGGELDGARILGPQTIAYMTSDHLGDIPHQVPDGVPTAGYLPGPGYGFGLGFGVRTEPGVAPVPGSVGEYYWGGYAGTYFWVDPKNDLAVVYMMQSVAERVPYRAVLRDMIYPAVMPIGPAPAQTN